MNKRIKIIILLFSVLLITITLSSCAARTYFPYGIWHSESLGLTLYIDHSHQINTYDYLGISSNDGVENKVIVVPSQVHGIILIFEYDVVDNEVKRGAEWLGGTYRIRNDRLYLQLHRNSQELIGISRIVFEKIAEVEVIE